MEIRFRGEEGDEYASWRELAEACPFAILDPESFSDEQLEFLIRELTPYAPSQVVKDGREEVDLPPSPWEIDRANGADCITRFAAMNLPRLLPRPDHLSIAETEAIEFLTKNLGGYFGLRRTLVKCQGAKKGWQVIVPKTGQRVEARRLVDLFELDFAERLSPLWHAVRLLMFAERARAFNEQTDIETILETGIAVGESRKALGFKVVGSSQARDAQAKSAKSRNTQTVERNAWILKKAKLYMQSQAYRRNVDKIAKKIVEDLQDEAPKHGWRKAKLTTVKEHIGPLFK